MTRLATNSGTPKVSIISPCYNVGSLIVETQKSIESQSFSDFEWIIVDDGSSSETISILKEIERSASIRVDIVFSNRQGGNVCRNLGFERSSGAFVKFLDADDLMEQYLLEEEYKLAVESPNHLVVSRTAKLIDRKYLILQKNYELEQSDPLMQYLVKPFFMHGGCLIPRAAVTDIGGWDESLKAGQDLDFFRRLLLTIGSDVVQQEKSYFYYRQHSETSRLSSNVGEQFTKYESQLAALDRFVELLQLSGRFSHYNKVIANNYELWGKYASRFCPELAPLFFAKAESMSSDLDPPGGRLYKILRRHFGAKTAARIVMSIPLQFAHQVLARTVGVQAEEQVTLKRRLREISRSIESI